MSLKLPFISDEFHFALASVAAYAAFLDATIEHNIPWLLPDHQNLSTSLLKLSTSGDRQADLVEALLLDCFPEARTEIEARMSAIKAMRRERNDLFHGLLGSKSPADVLITMHMRPHKEDRRVSKTLPEMEDLVNRMDDAILWLNDWSSRVMEQRVAKLRAELAMLTRQHGSLSTLGQRQPSTPGLLSQPPKPSQE